MPTIVFVSPKGGAGKTTASLVLATQLSRSTKVTIIDADPNHPIASWAANGDVPSAFSVVADADEGTIVDRIQNAAASSPFVIVDLEGTASKLVLLAISQADLVIVPTQGSELDAQQAGRALRVIKQHEAMSGRSLQYAVLLTRTNVAVRTRSTAQIQRMLMEAGIPVFKTHLHEREAYRAMFSFRRPLEGLDPTQASNIDKAIANAEELTVEVVEFVRGKSLSDSVSPLMEGL